MKQLRTDTCDICGRERPERAISVLGDVRYCNDDHNDLGCHIKVALRGDAALLVRAETAERALAEAKGSMLAAVFALRTDPEVSITTIADVLESAAFEATS